MRRRGFSKGLVFGLLPLVGTLLLVGTVLCGQGTNPLALFIDDPGNVGIGTKNPKAPLDVNGNAVIEGSMDVSKNAVIGGNVGIATKDPKAPLDVNGNAVIRGNVRIGDLKDYKNETVLSVAPGVVEFDAPDKPGGRLTINERG